MAFLEIIEFFDESGDIIVYRVPPEGSGEIRLGSQLIVQESQMAVFFKNGRACDDFGPGRHTLTTGNLPLLQKLVSIPFGQSPFRAYVHFVGLKTFTNLGWGTASPVVFRDADLRMITLRAHGIYSMRIVDPRLFLDTLVGTKGLETSFALEDFFRSMIVSRLNTCIGEKMKTILDLPQEYENIAGGTKLLVRQDFGQYGVELTDLIVEAITPPPQVQDMIDRASGIAAQDVTAYKEIAIADAMRDAANNPGGAGEGAGLGMGLGMGFGMAKQMAGQMDAGTPPAQPAPPAPTTPPAPPSLPIDEIKQKLERLKELIDEGLITEDDFAEQKRRLLDQL